MNESFASLSENRKAALYAFAVVGFCAMVAAGIWLAIYSSRYVPATVSNISAAAVALTSLFIPGDASLTVVPQATSTLPIWSGVASSTPNATPVPISTPVVPVPGIKTTEVHEIGTKATSTPPSSGPADLAATVTAAGYLANTNTESFVTSTTTPVGMRPAVKFVVKNTGGTASGTWRFAASIPTYNDYLYFSQPQQNLNPGDSIEYVLGFDQPRTGLQTITVTVNFDHFLNEPDYSNNLATTKTFVQSVY